jgi:hypothetical protein
MVAHTRALYAPPSHSARRRHDTLARVKRPTIYGDATKLRRTLAQYIGRGQELLHQGRGVRNRIEAMPADEALARFQAEQEWVKDVRRWRRNIIDTLGRYLGEQADSVLDAVLRVQLPPDTGKPRHHLGVDNLEPWLAGDIAGLKELQASLGVTRDVGAAPPPGPFAELRASGLVEPRFIDDRSREMLAPRTAKQLADAIGAAKELVEATLRGALTQLQVPWAKTDELTKLMGKWRTAVEAHTAPDAAGQAAARRLLASVARFSGEWRNSYGRGHGRTGYPPGVQPRHARFAADAAEAVVRFIVTTMDDAQLLPP